MMGDCGGVKAYRLRTTPLPAHQGKHRAMYCFT
jgi:hypothetical protein